MEKVVAFSLLSRRLLTLLRVRLLTRLRSPGTACAKICPEDSVENKALVVFSVEIPSGVSMLSMLKDKAP